MLRNKFRRLLGLGGLAAALALAPVYAAAQGGDVEGDGLAPLLREVTFEEILADPDNIELNVLYARTQIKYGRLDKAQSALERVLLIEPDLTMVRMLYGLVLFRLDNLSEAEGVFNALLESDITDTDRRQVEQFLRQIEKRKRRLKVGVMVSAGVHYDSNRTLAPRSGTLSLYDSVFQLDLPEKPDWGGVVNVGATARYDLGMQRPHELYGKAAVVLDEQKDENAYDMVMGRVDAGVIMTQDFGKLDLSLNHGIFNMNRKAYLNATGVKARWDAPPGVMLAPYAEVAATRQLFANRNGSNTNPERNGNLYQTTAGVRTTALIENGNTDFSVTRGVKLARMSYNTYDSWGLALRHTQVFDQGRYIIANAGVTQTGYRRADSYVGSKKRRDRAFNLGVTGGMALGSLPLASYYIPEEANDVLLSASVERSVGRSNIVNYEYGNWRTQVMLTKALDF